jgi:tRNA(Ile2) C34 agmatinyltransferase TiaS
VTDRRQPRPGLCLQCLKANRAAGHYRCKDCQTSWEARHNQIGKETT